ncbi:MAG TPA: hypothetical protein VGR90_10045 [Acidimicrobiales bacterium]|nr:hypothetical protein [Acidimicrobiales bacterium]
MFNPDDADFCDFPLRITITLDLRGYLGTDTVAAAALLDVLTRLEHDGIRPDRTTLEITEPTTPPA